MNLHILGIGGTFMGSLAVLAKAAGHRVSGTDQTIYPPMSDVLNDAGITTYDGYEPSNIESDTDLVIIGNALSRGNRCVEHVLNDPMPFDSGPGWLGREILSSRRVIAVAGTHGKTSTTCMVARILDQAGYQPGFLIGGRPQGFSTSARLGDPDGWFVIEADEYDTAFFDKRSKFVHYHPTIAVLNNLEFDHADIFADLAAIETQFHHLLRTVPGNGTVIVNAASEALARVVDRGCWSELVAFGGEDSAWTLSGEAGRRKLHAPSGIQSLDWQIDGEHHAMNALAAVCAARHAGVPVSESVQSLQGMQLPRRRQEILAERGGITVMDDFAHHPTAIRTTIEGLNARLARNGESSRLIVVLEPRSNTMRAGIHRGALGPATRGADLCIVVASESIDWDLESEFSEPNQRVLDSADETLATLMQECRRGDLVVFMSNGAFAGIPHRFARWIKDRA